jgi:hypothetical protein
VLLDAIHLAPEAQIQVDVAVVGAGPAGIVLALELARAGISVAVIESGGESFSADVQRLGDTAGGDSLHVPMSLTTRRQVGGASNLWAGRCLPFDPIDFQSRQIVGNARWPVDYDDLEPYFLRACEWFMCGQALFDAREIPNLAERSLIPGWPGGEMLATALERWSLPTNFGQQYRERLKTSDLVTLVTNLTCTEIVCAPDGASVAYLLGRTLTGKRILVRAKRYSLACGGLEATRLLFASNRVHRGGIGSHSGHLGHWYMAHVEGRIARIHLSTPPAETIYDYERDPDGVYVRRRFTFTQDFLVEHDLPNTAMWIANPQIGDPSHENGILSLIYLTLASPLGRYLIAEGIRQGQIKTTRRVSERSHWANVRRNLGPAARFALTFGYHRFIKRGRKVPGVFVPSASNAYPLVYHGEHLPHYDSHVTPTDERDALGMPRLRTRLHFDESDFRGAVRAHEHFDRYLRNNGLGHLEYLYQDSEEALRQQVFGGYHQVGTTRMSASPEDGVLDPDLAVHGLEDLYVASGSAFVTSSQANTTFMIVVFALRLADHLRHTLHRMPEITASHG